MAPSLAFAQQKKQDSDQPLTLCSTDIVLLRASVTDKGGKPFEGLTRLEFTVTDNKKQQEIVFFREAKGEPASVGILLDMSYSVSATIPSADLVNEIRRELLRFIDNSGPSDEFFLMGFNDRVHLMTDWTRNRDLLFKSLNRMTDPEGSTSLLDAIYFGAEKVEQGKNGNRALIVISDGIDSSSRRQLDDVKRQVSKSGVRVYAFGITELLDLGRHTNLSILDSLSSISGGTTYVPKYLSRVREYFSRIATELRHQYLIGYYPGFLSDGEWRAVGVKVAPVPVKDDSGKSSKKIHPSARTSAGYFAIK
jgi:Ca-activated chloride channel family protein